MIYNIDGAQLLKAYDVNGSELSAAYDINGNLIYSAEPSWYDEITTETLRDSAAQTTYYVITIPKSRPGGAQQYPFVFVPDGSEGGTMSTLTMMQTYGFYFGMNAGYFDYAQSHTYRPYGITVENSQLIRADYEYFRTNYTLTIDGSGNLNYEDTIDSGLTAQDVLDSGAVSAVLGYVPLVINGQPADVQSGAWTSTERAQRQIIGQKQNGDYVIITCEGRGYNNSQGFTVSEARALCVNMGLYFAMMLDGGGSTETVIGTDQINEIYEGSTGRIVPTYIIFNGTDTF